MVRGPAVAAAVGLLLFGLVPASDNHLVRIEFVSPDPQRPNPKFNDLLPLVVTSGWTLSLKLEMPGAGIGQAVAFDAYPAARQTGYAVFDDPDGCFSPACSIFGPVTCGMNQCPAPDETMVEFTSDHDMWGAEDFAGNAAVRALQGVPEPLLRVFDGPLAGIGTNTLPREYAESSVEDGYSPGPDDDLPGLVLLVDSGLGLIFDVNDSDLDGDIAEVRGARNLAGLLNQVGYTLSSSRHGGVNVRANLQVTDDITAAVVLLDECSAGLFTRVNGGPPMPIDLRGMEGFDLPFDTSIRIRAFVVNGVAPATLEDLDGNGVIDSADAAAAGYQVLSNEAVLELLQYYQPLEDFLSPNYFDIDGDGFAVCVPPVAPPGPGTVTPPPR